MISKFFKSTSGFIFFVAFAILLAVASSAQEGPGGLNSTGNTRDALGNLRVTAPLNPEVAVPLDPVQAKATAAQAIAAFDNVVLIATNAIRSIQTGSGNTAGVLAYGKRLTLMLTGIVIVWAFLRNLLLKQSFQQLFGDLVFPLIIAGFVLGPGLDRLPTAIEAATTRIGGAFAGTSTGSIESSLVGSMFTSAMGVWNADNGGGIKEIFTSPINKVVQFVLRMIVILLIMLCGALGVAAVLVAKFQIALAIGLAPLLIPWIVFKPTEFLFSGWLSFLLKAGFGMVGVLAVGSVVTAGARSMASMISSMPTNDEGTMTYAAMAGMSIIFAFLMAKAADIGAGVISGSASGISGIAAAAKGAAVMTPLALTGAAAGAVGSAGRVGAATAVGKAMAGSNDGSGNMSGMAQLARGAIAGRSKTAQAAFNAAHGNSKRAGTSNGPSSPAPAAPVSSTGSVGRKVKAPQASIFAKR
jgi:hypothetical protein